MPSYGYSNNIETLISRLEQEYRRTQENLPVEFLEASRILREMGTAFTENRLGEYISSRPALKSKFDLLSLSNQQVEVLDYAENPVFNIRFDKESSGFRSYKRILTNIDVEFNEQEKLVFKGVVVSEVPKHQLKKRIGLIHIFNDIEKKDVIDWDYDKELLVILHRQRGFILYHMMFAPELLGSTPIPSIRLPAGDLLNLQNVKLEFINRAVLPPVKADHNDVAVNLDAKPMFSAGDLLVSYENSENNKTITRVLARSGDFMPALFKMYMILGSLIKIEGFKNDGDSSSSSYLERHLTEIMQTVLSATLNRNAISFFNKFSDLIEIIPYFLVYKYVDKNPDRFLHTEWFTDYQKIRESSPELFSQRSKVEGNIILSERIAEALKPIVTVKKKEQKKKLKEWLSEKKALILGKIDPILEKTAGFEIKGNELDIGIILFCYFYAIGHSLSLPRAGEVASYTSNTIYNLTALGVGFLLIIAMLGRFSIPFLKGLKKLPVSGEFKLTLDQIIEKWGKDHIRVRDKLLGFGFKIAASLLPLFYRVFQLSGQRHLFSTLTYGVNPFRKITSDSPLGRAAGIEQPMLLGLGWPRWKGKNYEKKSQLINLVGEQKRRVDRLSRIMSYYTLTNQTFDIRVVLTGPLALDSNLDYIDQKLLRNFTWISEELSKHILKSDKIDTTRPIFEWDITVINNDFNQKALSLAQEVKSISWTKKQMRELRKTTTKYLQQGLAWNTKHAEVLMSYYPEPWLANQFFTGLIIDQSIMSSAPLTPLTPRGDFYSGNMGVVAVEPYTLLRSNMPHIHEGGLNIVFHDVIMARQKLQYLVLKKNEKLKKLFEELKDPYEHIEKYLNITKNEPTAGQYILDASKYPGNWGERIYEGTEHEERIDVGWQLWKFATIGLRFFVVAFPLGVLSREVFAPEYSFYSNIVGTLFFAGAGFFIFALPQLWAMQHNAAFVKRSKETKEMIDRIKLVAHNIEQNLYTSSASINGAYRKALDNFKKLYYSSKPFRKGISLDQVEPGIKEFVLQADVEEARLKEFIQSQTIEEKREQIQIISSLLKTRYLPTESNTYGFGLAMLLGLGIWSNIFFVFVSDKSFQNITFSDAVFWYGAMIASAGIFSLLSSKSISNHIKNIRRRAKGIGPVIHSKCSLVFRSLKLKK